MNELAVWWIGIEAAGIAAFPLAFVFFHRLPDRGFAFSKVIGLLLLGYGLWMGAFLGLFPNARGTVILLLVVLAAVSLLVASGRRDEMAAYFRSNWRYILLVEAMFAAVLASAVFLRSFAPDINSGEKPFELAFLNSVYRAGSFPPPDPWLSGHSISYYYFGYVIVSALTKLVALDTNVGFFLGLSLMAALAWTAAFGLVYNLVAASRRGRGGPGLDPRAVVFGLAAAVLVLVVSNLEGVFELMARHGAGSHGFFDSLGIYGLPDKYDCASTPADCAHWYPTRSYWWWWATRMGSNYDIQEFPYFSYHFGDLHAHVMAMPMLITLFAVAYQFIAGATGDAPGLLWPVRHPWRVLLVVLLAGGIAFTDAWAVPLTVLLLAASVLAANWLHFDRGRLRAMAHSLAFILPVVAGMFILYLPYYWLLQADTRGVAVAHTAATSGAVPQVSEATRPMHFLLFWGPLLWVILPYLVARLWRRRDRAFSGAVSLLALVPPLVPIVLWAALIGFGDGPGALRDEFQERGANLVTLGILVLAVTAAALAFLDALRRDAEDRDRCSLFVILLAGFALMMLLGAELYYVKDALGFRANTVFRFWHEGWVLMGVAGAFGLYRLTLGWRLPRFRTGAVPWRYVTGWGATFGAAYTVFVAIDPWETLYARWWTATPGLFVLGASAAAFAALSAVQGASRVAAARRLAWLGATVIVLAAALVYPVLVTFDRTGGFRNPQTLNGLDFVHRSDPTEYEAIQWLKTNVSGAPVLLEATGDDFSDAARISSRTGLPTVIGWVRHEEQWRGSPGPQNGGAPDLVVRPFDVAHAYTTADAGEAEAVIEKYGVQYVYVGRLERETYGTSVPGVFAEFMDVAFENKGVTIYRAREGAVELPPR